MIEQNKPLLVKGGAFCLPIGTSMHKDVVERTMSFLKNTALDFLCAPILQKITFEAIINYITNSFKYLR